jgi:hypothetical protein
VRTIPELGAAAIVAAATITMVLSPADAETARFTATPTSGPAGTSIVLTSITPCRLPAGVTGAPFIRASLSRGSTVITASTIALNSSGMWTGRLTVGSQAAPGVDTIEAFCFASPQAEGAVLAYSPRTFTVTASAGLASTGAGGWTAGVVAVMLIAAGGSLMVAGRRRGTPPAGRR